MRVPSDGHIERPGILSGRTVDDGQISLFDLAIRKRFGEDLVGLGGSRKDHDAAGVLVQAMNNTRAVGATCIGHLWKLRQQAMHQRPLLVAGSWVDYDAGRLVQNDDAVVFIENDEVARLGGVLWKKNQYVKTILVLLLAVF